MLKELPKLLGRGFAIGFFLPSAAAALAALGVASALGSPQPLAWLLAIQDLLDLALGVGAVWLFAVLLMALNRQIYRLYEGYVGPGRLFARRTHRRFERLTAQLERLDSTLVDQGLSDAARHRRNAVVLQLVREFPEPEHLLPTRFGNVIRAFESYSRVMYGLDDIPGWLRLLAVMPQEYQTVVDDQKAITDFWLNLRFLAAAVAAETVALSIMNTPATLAALVIMTLAVLVELWSSAASRAAAVQWGEAVKASYDVFLPRLRDALGLSEPDHPDDEQDQWQAFSRAVIYRHPHSLPPRRHGPAGATVLASHAGDPQTDAPVPYKKKMNHDKTSARTTEGGT